MGRKKTHEEFVDNFNTRNPESTIKIIGLYTGVHLLDSGGNTELFNINIFDEIKNELGFK